MIVGISVLPCWGLIGCGGRVASELSRDGESPPDASTEASMDAVSDDTNVSVRDAETDPRPPFDGTSSRCLLGEGSDLYLTEFPGLVGSVEFDDASKWSGHAGDADSWLRLDIKGPGSRFASIDFTTGRSDERIRARRYERISAFVGPRSEAPGLAVNGGSGASCSELTGWIEIHEFGTNGSGIVNVFTASFAFDCNGRNYVRGCVDYLRP